MKTDRQKEEPPKAEDLSIPSSVKRGSALHDGLREWMSRVTYYLEREGVVDQEEAKKLREEKREVFK